MPEGKYNLLVIIGPTASGKTKLAVKLADYLNTELISADSRQVYQGMNIGTGKDLKEFEINDKSLKYHLIDILNAGNQYNVADFQRDFYQVFQKLRSENLTPILCGGTGLYIQSVLQNFSKTQVSIDENIRLKYRNSSKAELLTVLKTYENWEEIDTSTSKRILRGIEILSQGSTENVISNDKIIPLVIGICPSTAVRRQRITERLRYRIEVEGLVNEVKELLHSGINAEKLYYYGLEYKYVTQYVLEILSFDDMFKKLETEIHRYAKRQMTFFRSMEKKGIAINWIDGDMDTNVQFEACKSIMNS